MRLIVTPFSCVVSSFDLKFGHLHMSFRTSFHTWRTWYYYNWAEYFRIHGTSVECRLIIYIRPGTGGYRLTTYIRLRNEFCNTESSYDEIMSGLHSYLIFPNISFMCAYSNVVRTFAPTPPRLPLIGSTPINHCISWTFPLCTIHLHHRTPFHLCYVTF